MGRIFAHDESHVEALELINIIGEVTAASLPSQTMVAKKIFYRISDYVSRHFRGSFLYKTKTSRDAHGNIFYDVELSQDDMIHHLRFNAKGNLVSKEVEEAFPEESE